MSHELRTPLNAIIGYSEMLRDEFQECTPEEITADLERIGSAGKHLLTIINDILDISKIEAGRMELYLEWFPLAGLIDNVRSHIYPLMQQHDNTLHTRCAPEVDSMYADLTKVRQILLNLLSNAAKFTHQGTIELDIQLLTDESGIQQICFRVTDMGIGMTPEQIQGLFQPFAQGDTSTTRRYGGTGLGLAISHRFCLMMGGTIHVESAINQGATFRVYLPREVVNKEISTSSPNRMSQEISGAV
jgi:signal transduction histidine kinase